MADTGIINLRYPEGTLGSSSYPEKFNHQAFEQLKQTYLSKERLFVDNTFSPDNNSLGDLPYLSVQQTQQVEWLRPVDIMKRNNITKELTFIADGASRFDFAQGLVGNSWFLAAIASLTIQKELLVQVVPQEQNFQDYAGIFHFRFWRFGRWVDVVIDDFLPVIGNKLLFTRSKSNNEFWAPLLEKAYAKVCGSYADMSAALPSEAFKDLSGGVHMTYKLQGKLSPSHEVELWASLSRATMTKALICCSTINKGISVMDSVAHTGLVDGHAYSITGIMEIEHLDTKVKLIKLMNPWGHTEWNGKWSDKSILWDDVIAEVREKSLKRNDGEFWMELEDFYRYFDILSICGESPTFLDGDVTHQWKYLIHNGRWVAGMTAGGNINEETFATNPQYWITVKEMDEEMKVEKNVLLSLMQKPAHRHRKDIRFSPIGLTIFQVPSGTPEGRLDSSFFSKIQPVKPHQMYSSDRELIEFHSLKPGQYLLVPSTMTPNRSGEFVLSVYSKPEVIIVDADIITDVIHTAKIPEGDFKSLANDMFKRYADQNGELGDLQLQKLLNENFPNGTSFDLEISRSIIALMDTNRMGKMTFTEFLTLWNKFEEFKRSALHWVMSAGGVSQTEEMQPRSQDTDPIGTFYKIFYHADISQTGTLSYEELMTAMKTAGMEVDSTMVNLLTKRYSSEKSIISMENFLALMLRLDIISSVFKDNATDGMIHMDWKDWSNVFLYA